MQNAIRQIPMITLILLTLSFGCDRDDADHTEILTIGPYRTDCVGAHPQECYLEYNEEAEAWHFFYDGIAGFDYEEGYIYTLKVSVHELSDPPQDAGRYEYSLVEVLSKEPAPVDERPPRKPSME